MVVYPRGVHTDRGGVKVTDSKIPQDVLDSLEDSYTVRYSDGNGDIYNNPVQTYLLRRADREIWVHLATDSASGGWIIAETTGDPSTGPGAG